MKTKIYITALAALFMGSALTSCSDYLEATNKTAGGQESDAFFSANPDLLLTSAYAALKPIVNQVEIYDMGTDLYINTRGHSAGDFGTYSLAASNATCKSLYVNCYGAINYANGVIKYAPEGSIEAAEARFIRNYTYYVLLQQFGGVPYITEYIQSATTSYPRESATTVYASVIADLESLLLSPLPDKSAHNGHVSKQAVNALLAKVYLAAGWDLNTSVADAKQGTYTVNGTGYFEWAYYYANQALDGVDFYDEFNDKWLPDNQDDNAEEIFSVKYQRAGFPGDVADGGNNLMYTYGGYPTGSDKAGLKYVNSDLQQSAKSMALFEKGDKRYEATFMTTFYDGESLGDGYMAYYKGVDPNTHKINARWFPCYMTVAECEAELNAHVAQYQNLNSANSFKAALLDPNGITTWTLSGTTFKKTTGITMTTFNTQTNNGTCVKKFDDPEAPYSTKTQCYRDIVLLHASDIRLVAAEAALMGGAAKSEFWNIINEVRDRAGLAQLSNINDYQPLYNVPSTFGATTELDLLLDERARELYAERTRYEDLRRTKQLVRYNVAFNESVTTAEAMTGNGQYKWLRPIPQDAIDANEGITSADQNPGY